MSAAVMPRRDAVSRSMRSVSLRSSGLLVAGYVGELWDLLQSLQENARCPLIQFIQVDVGQRVPVLRRCQPAADVDVLHGLHEQTQRPTKFCIAASSRFMTWPIGGRIRCGFSTIKILPWFSVDVAPPAPDIRRRPIGAAGYSKTEMES